MRYTGAVRAGSPIPGGLPRWLRPEHLIAERRPVRELTRRRQELDLREDRPEDAQERWPSARPWYRTRRAPAVPLPHAPDPRNIPETRPDMLRSGGADESSAAL